MIADPDPTEERGERRLVEAVAGHAMAFGLIVSALVHLALLLLAAFIFMFPPAGSGDDAGSAIEVAVLHESELAELQAGGEAFDPFSTSDLAMVEEITVSTQDLSIAMPEIVGERTGGPSPLGGAGSGAAAETSIAGGSGGAASFFGLESRGTRFVYIVDVSGSMRQAGKLGVLQQQLIASINGLPERARFNVIFYNDNAQILTGNKKWLRAEGSQKRFAARIIRGVSSGGGTNPLPAFEAAFSLRPKPDAIFFMTDGVFPYDLAPEALRLNLSRGALTPINTISFISREAADQLQRIAEQSGGVYTHVRDPAL